jgi:hypothetical protein
VEGVIGTEEGAQSFSRIVRLCPAFWGEFDSMVGDRLVDIAVFYTVSVAFCLWRWQYIWQACSRGHYSGEDSLLPSDWACLIKMIIRGFPILRERLPVHCFRKRVVLCCDVITRTRRRRGIKFENLYLTLCVFAARAYVAGLNCLPLRRFTSLIGYLSAFSLEDGASDLVARRGCVSAPKTPTSSSDSH